MIGARALALLLALVLPFAPGRPVILPDPAPRPRRRAERRQGRRVC